MSAYQKIIVYYFSGTGNAKNVAMWVSMQALENKVECRLINIAQIDRRNITPPDTNALLIFISPIHGFNYPPVMLHFIMRFPKAKNNVIFMNTRAGMLIGKYITPGLTGIAFYLSMVIFKLKGFSIKALFPVDLPSNWISLHPGLNEKTVTYLHEKNKKRVSVFIQDILSGKSNFKALFEIQDILVIPIAILYYFIGRFFLSKTFYASRDCNQCGICIKGCPVKAINYVDKRPYWTFNCESCMKCMSHCPKKAIETAHGFIIVYSILFSYLILTNFYKLFEQYFFKIENGFLEIIVESSLMLLFLALSYRILHYGMRFKFIERIIVFTSLTKYKFWGRRYKALNPNTVL